MAKTITVRSTNAFDDAKREKLMGKINDLDPTQLKNLEHLMNSPKAIKAISSDMAFMKLKLFL